MGTSPTSSKRTEMIWEQFAMKVPYMGDVQSVSYFNGAVGLVEG
jgi:hypothetical protein